jgi:hypothetical protein
MYVKMVDLLYLDANLGTMAATPSHRHRCARLVRIHRQRYVAIHFPLGEDRRLTFEGGTTELDKTMVANMVRRYMENERTM